MLRELPRSPARLPILNSCPTIRPAGNHSRSKLSALATAASLMRSKSGAPWRGVLTVAGLAVAAGDAMDRLAMVVALGTAASVISCPIWAGRIAAE